MYDLTDPRLAPYRVPHPAGMMSPEIMPYAGTFIIPFHRKAGGTFKVSKKADLRVIASRANPLWAVQDRDEGWLWDHVSVSLANRTPTWNQMCFIKDLFWSEEEAVMQLHPPRSDWINNHAHCLHLWRPVHSSIPLPPSVLVGLKELNL